MHYSCKLSHSWLLSTAVVGVWLAENAKYVLNWTISYRNMVFLGTEQGTFRRQEMRVDLDHHYAEVVELAVEEAGKEEVAKELGTVAMRRSGDGKTRTKLAEGAKSERGK
jgi:hypothetical protein